MSYEPDYRPPPPSSGAPPAQVLAFSVLGAALVGFVVFALSQSPESYLQIGILVVVLGLFFAAGMVSRNEIVQLIAAGIMMFGGGIAIGLGIRNEQAFWYVGAALFFICAVIIVSKERFIESKT